MQVIRNIMDNNNYQVKYSEALKTIKKLNSHINLVWDILKIGSYSNTFEEVFLGLRQLILDETNAHIIYLYNHDRGKYSLLDEMSSELPSQMHQYDTIDNLRKGISEYHDIRRNFTIISHIKIEERKLAALVAVPAKGDVLLRDAENILTLLSSLLSFKEHERIRAEYYIYQKAVEENAIIMAEHLRLQEKWIRELRNQISRVSYGLEKREVDYSENIQKLSQLNAQVESLLKTNYATRFTLNSYHLYDLQKSNKLTINIHSILKEVKICFQETEFEIISGTIYVDPDLATEGVKQILGVLQEFMGSLEDVYTIRGSSGEKSTITIRIGSKKMNYDILTKLMEISEPLWDDEDGVIISGKIIRTFALAKKLIENSGGVLDIYFEEEDDQSGFAITWNSC